MWDLIVSVPDHCLSFYSDQTGRLHMPFCWFCYEAAQMLFTCWYHFRSSVKVTPRYLALILALASVWPCSL